MSSYSYVPLTHSALSRSEPFLVSCREMEDGRIIWNTSLCRFPIRRKPSHDGGRPQSSSPVTRHKNSITQELYHDHKSFSLSLFINAPPLPSREGKLSSYHVYRNDWNIRLKSLSKTVAPHSPNAWAELAHFLARDPSCEYFQGYRGDFWISFWKLRYGPIYRVLRGQIGG